MGNQQVQRVCSDSWTVLQGSVQVRWKRALALSFAPRTHFHFGVNVTDRLFKDDIDPGSPFVFPARDVAQGLAADLTLIQRDDFYGLHRARIAGANAVVPLALAF